MDTREPGDRPPRQKNLPRSSEARSDGCPRSRPQPDNRRWEGSCLEVTMEKEQNVLERVYEPRRLLEAWRQVKGNAGAAGVDRMRA